MVQVLLAGIKQRAPEVVEERFDARHRIPDDDRVEEPAGIRSARLRSGEILTNRDSLQIAQVRCFHDELVDLQ